jgi:hypothetical protein
MRTNVKRFACTVFVLGIVGNIVVDVRGQRQTAVRQYVFIVVQVENVTLRMTFLYVSILIAERVCARFADCATQTISMRRGRRHCRRNKNPDKVNDGER